MEKNHKHEMGVEIAHHKEVQRNLLKLSEENRELKVKLEVRGFLGSLKMFKSFFII
jgi:mRNA-degrading endonuclease RelE of RelBE toxin-antitoxin system